MKYKFRVLFSIKIIILLCAISACQTRIPFDCEQLKNDPLFQIDDKITYQEMTEWVQTNYKGLDPNQMSEFGSSTSTGYVGWRYPNHSYRATFQNSKLTQVQVDLANTDFRAGDLVSCIGEPVAYIASVRQDSGSLAKLSLAYPERRVVFTGAHNGDRTYIFDETFNFNQWIFRFDEELMINDYPWASWKPWASWQNIQVDIDPLLQ